ncbi:peptidoglycan DD-metalloendopeptidase family protein [Methyloceanibacter sp.]|uniref:murein hydrolase activator EnvC family protein n=1 Tax=Methyloceanibacter sp. TaxID=1965321 RepID=UPI002BDE0362|nr:peptidoglycan DD-metalloendopeptidase family protein [Methyloceanibacter sp.]HML93231.1 peptidoglycan DD-metalloendopeptidase family protein [Methyloceanibacter sp.]
MAHSKRLTFTTRNFRVALVVTVLLGVPAGHAYGQEDLSRDEAKQRLDETEHELESSRVKAEGLTKDLAVLAEERARLNSELIEAGKRVQESEARLSETESELAELTAQVNAMQNSINERKAAIVTMLSAMQRIGRTPPPAIVTRRDDALKVVRGAMLLAEIYPELKYQADSLTESLQDISAVEERIRAERDAQRRDADQLAAEQERLDRLIAEKKSRQDAGQQELADLNQSAKTLAAEVESLNDLVEQLDEKIAKAEVAQYDAELAAETALRTRLQQEVMATPANERVVELKPDAKKVAFASPDRMKPAVPFDQSKGSLRLPAQGQRTHGFGDKDAAGAALQGVSLETRAEARVTAPADGWVVYAGPFRSYGQLLIINAGGGYHILLAGMSRIDVSLGQFVLAGEPIAVMGDAVPPGDRGGQSSRPVLYVEFRKDGRPIDPGPWWAAASGKVQG